MMIVMTEDKRATPVQRAIRNRGGVLAGTEASPTIMIAVR